MKEAYTQPEFDELVARTAPRDGWDFSRMNVLRQPVPWDYEDVVRRYLRPADTVLDVGTGGGERFVSLATSFGRGVGVDIDAEMISAAQQNSTTDRISFVVSNERLDGVAGHFDAILNRHAPLDLRAVLAHLTRNGYFVTQQVGERNMANVRAALRQPPISGAAITAAGLRLIAFLEYDVEYVVRDIESLVFWLTALDLRHADLDGAAALADVTGLNQILRDNVDNRGFVTNEHRYLVIAQR
jgi:Methyltransferase domain